MSWLAAGGFEVVLFVLRVPDFLSDFLASFDFGASDAPFLDSSGFLDADDLTGGFVLEAAEGGLLEPDDGGFGGSALLIKFMINIEMLIFKNNSLTSWHKQKCK